MSHETQKATNMTRTQTHHALDADDCLDRLWDAYHDNDPVGIVANGNALLRSIKCGGPLPRECDDPVLLIKDIVNLMLHRAAELADRDHDPMYQAQIDAEDRYNNLMAEDIARNELGKLLSSIHGVQVECSHSGAMRHCDAAQSYCEQWLHERIASEIEIDKAELARVQTDLELSRRDAIRQMIVDKAFIAWLESLEWQPPEAEFISVTPITE